MFIDGNFVEKGFDDKRQKWSASDAQNASTGAPYQPGGQSPRQPSRPKGTQGNGRANHVRNQRLQTQKDAMVRKLNKRHNAHVPSPMNGKAPKFGFGNDGQSPVRKFGGGGGMRNTRPMGFGVARDAERVDMESQILDERYQNPMFGQIHNDNGGVGRTENNVLIGDRPQDQIGEVEGSPEQERIEPENVIKTGGGAYRPTKGLFNESTRLDFLTEPSPKDTTIQCYIIRSNKRKRYDVFLKDNKSFMMAAKKRVHNKSSNYLISTDQVKLKKKDVGFVGKLRSNFIGTDFTLYNDGMNPDKASKTTPQSTVRKELLSVVYQKNLFGTRGPREMEVLVPKLAADWGPANVIFRPPYTGKSLIETFKGGSVNKFYLLKNRQPKWNEELNGWVLNFNGRVTKASVKNFQLVYDKDEGEGEKEPEVVLQFGRVDKSKFTMDFRYPLTPLQAFGICLSSLDKKYACE